MRGLSLKPMAALLLASFIAATPLQDNEANANSNSLSAEFNRKAVARSYAMACDERDYLRDANIKEPSQRSTPKYFKKKLSDIALYSPLLKPEEKEAAERLMESIPDYARDLFYTQGGVFIFTAQALAEALPDYSDYRKKDGSLPYQNTYVGLYIYSEKRAYLTFYTGVLDKNGQVIGYEVMDGNKPRIFHHEIGHFLDDVLGEVGAPFFEFGAKRFTDRDSFKDSLKADMDALVDDNKSFTVKDFERRSYFLPETHKEKPLYGKRKGYLDTRKEVFAELWAETQGRGVYNLYKYFPRTYKLMQDMDKELQQLYSKNTKSCDLPTVVPVP